MVFEEKTFENSTHVLDDNHYKACEFRNCTIIYRGGLLRLDQCHFATCLFRVEAPAANVLEFLRIVYKIYPGGPQAVAKILDLPKPDPTVDE